MTAVIYALRCPVSNQVRYIGKSKHPEKRLAAHICRASDLNAQQHCARWIRKVLAQGLKPSLEILYHIANGEDWEVVEARFIAQFRESGHDLTNMTSGGDGFHDLSPDVIQKRSSMHRVSILEAWKDPLYRARHRAGRIAALSAPEVRAKMSATAKEIAARPGKLEAMSVAAKTEWKRRKARMSAAQYARFCEEQGRRLTELLRDPEYKARFVAAAQAAEVHARRVASRAAPESKAKCIAKMKATWAVPEVRARRLANMQTPEAIAKRTEAQKLAWADPEAKARRIASMNTPEVRAKNSAAQKAAWARRKAAQSKLKEAA